MPRERDVVIGLLFATLLVASPAQAQRQIPINIESTPPGAAVFVDSTAAPIGTTPMRSVRVPSGTHTLIFRLENHEEGRLQVNVRRWRETFRIVLNPLGSIMISAGNDAANGAAIRIDGQPVGNVPFRTNVQPGRHQVQVQREGYRVFSQWVDLTGGQVLTLPVMLEREAPVTGSILVAADLSGAPIFLDGAPRGTTPTVIEDVPAGDHTIEIRPEGGEVFRERVIVQAGQRATVNATLRPRPAAAGSLRVVCNAPGCIIRVDGETAGEAPARVGELSPGEHIVEASAQGHQPATQTVTVESGRERVISIQLERGGSGRIVVNADVDGAVVVVDGTERGTAPVVIADAEAGTHAIAVRAPGHQEFRATCEVGPGRDCNINAHLGGVGTEVHVRANVTGAHFLVDEEEVGPVPFEGTIPVGSHRIEVRARGYHSYVAQVQLRAQAEPRLFDVTLVSEDEMTDEQRAARQAERRAARREAVSRSAAPIPGDMTVLDASIGWPHVAELRMGVGIWSFADDEAGLVAGFGVRSFGRLTEFDARIQLGYRPIRQISVGTLFRIGGGIGPSRGPARDECLIANMQDPPPMTTCSDPGEDLERHPANAFFTQLDALFALHFSRAGAFSLWLGMDFHSDRYDWTARDSNVLHGMRRDPDTGAITVIDAGDYLDRQVMLRLRAGGSLEIVVNHHWNVWVLLEGIIAGPERRVYGDVFNTNTGDTFIYGRAGFTYKFGTTEEGDPEPPPQ